MMTEPISTTETIVPSSGETDLAAARAGDVAAFERLIEPVEERLFRQAFALCQNQTTAEELAQETLIAAWHGIDRFDGQCRLFTWLYAILLRRHKKRIRSLTRKPLLFWGLFQSNREHPEARPDPQHSPPEDPVSHVVSKERHEQLAKSIETLPPKHQEVIRLRFFADASLEEIAVATQSSVGTIKSRLHYALEKLRQKDLTQRL